MSGLVRVLIFGDQTFGDIPLGFRVPDYITIWKPYLEATIQSHRGVQVDLKNNLTLEAMERREEKKY